MNDTDPPDDHIDALAAASEVLQRATIAGKIGDFFAFYAAMVESRVLEGLKRRLQKNWPRLHPDDVDLAVGEATDQLFTDLKDGKTITSVIAWLFKVASRQASLQWAHRQHESGQDQELFEQHPDKRNEVGEEVLADPQANIDWRDRRLHALQVARKLLTEIGHLNAQRVMAHILDAVQAEREDVTDREIADALGDVSKEHVKKLRQRAFERLARVVREKGWGDMILEFLARHQSNESEEDEDEKDDGSEEI